MSMKDLEAFSSSLKKDFKKAMFTSPSWEHRVMPTGVVSVDTAIRAGGFGEGRISEIYGPYSSGKTLLLYQWLIHNQQRGGMTFLYESEGGFHEDWFVDLGGLFDTGSPLDLHLVPDLSSVEDFFDGCYKIIDRVKKSGIDVPVAIGWDSLAATSCRHVLGKKAGEGHAAKKAAVISEGSAVLMSKLQGTRVSIVNTNQIRVKQGAKDWEETHTPGGRSWPFACSTRIELEFHGGPKGSQIIDPVSNEMIGRWVRGKVTKNKLGAPGGKFRLPIYTIKGREHPEFPGLKTKVGIDLNEALFNYYATSESAVFGEDRTRFMESTGGGRYKLNLEVFGEFKSFFRKDWPQVLEAFPILLCPEEINVG